MLGYSYNVHSWFCFIKFLLCAIHCFIFFPNLDEIIIWHETFDRFVNAGNRQSVIESQWHVGSDKMSPLNNTNILMNLQGRRVGKSYEGNRFTHVSDHELAQSRGLQGAVPIANLWPFYSLGAVNRLIVSDGTHITQPVLFFTYWLSPFVIDTKT